MNNALENKIDEIHDALKTNARFLQVDDFHLTFHTESVKFVTLDGLWMEFGVYRGRSIDQFASLTENKIYGFDSFEGLPEFWDHDNPKGVYGLNGIIPPGIIVGENQSMYDNSPTVNYKPWPKNVALVKGLFDATLPKFLERYPEVAAFIHIDSDIYSSAKTIFDCMKDRIVPGTVIVFDEIDNYPTFREHEIKAFAEFLLNSPHLSYEALLYSGFGYGQGTFKIIANE